MTSDFMNLHINISVLLANYQDYLYSWSGIKKSVFSYKHTQVVSTPASNRSGILSFNLSVYFFILCIEIAVRLCL